MAIRRDENYLMNYEDTGGFGGDEFDNFIPSGITSLPIQQPVIQPIAQPIVQPIVQPVAPVVAPQPEVQQVQQVIQPIPQPIVQPSPSIVQPIAQPLTPFAPPVVEQVAQEENTGVFGLPSVQPPPVVPPAQPAAPVGPDPKAIDALTNQILGQGLTSKWSGEGFGSAEKNAADMAKILAGIGITDIKQFGKFTQTGINESVYPDGRGGFVDLRGKPVDPSLVQANEFNGEAGSWTDYSAPVGTQEVFGNKITKQAVPITYSERQTGNFFGGTFAGKGNTGYGVQFDAQGNPIFYTQGASSNDLANIMKDLGPLGQIAIAAATGGLSLPAQLAANAGIQLLAGGNLGDIVKGTALSYLGGQAGNLISGSSGITDLLGKTGSDIAARTTQQFVGSGGKADLGQALLGNVVGSGVNSVIGELPGLDSLSATDKNLTSNLIAAVATGTPIDQAIQNALVGKASSLASGAVAEARNAAPAPQTYEDMMASIMPKMPDQPSTDTGPSNDEILKQIGYEPEPVTVSQEPQNINELLAQLEPLKEKAAPGINVAEQQASAERVAQEQAAREKAYQEQADRDAQERQAAIQKANEEAEAAQRAHDEQVAQETKAAKERQDAIDKAAAEAKQADDARAQAKAKADQEEHDAQVAKDAQAAAERQAAIDRERAQAEADQKAYEEQVARETQEAKDKQDAIDRANAEAKKQILPEPTPEPTNVTELLRQIQPEPIVEPAVQPVAEEPVAQPTVTEEPASIDELLRSLQPYAEPTVESRTLPQEVPQIEEKPVIQDMPFDLDKLLGQLPTQEEQPAVDNLINKAVTDTLGTKTETAAEPATGKEKTMDEDTGGDYMGNLSSLINPSGFNYFEEEQAPPPANIDDVLNSLSGGVNEDFLKNLSPDELARYRAMQQGDYTPPSYDVQDSGVSQQMMDEFNKNFNPAGGFGSQYQTVGTNRVMINDDGTATILDPTTGQSSYLDEDQVKALVKNGTLNSSSSGYVGATGGTGSTPGGSKASTSTSKTAAKPTAASPGTNNNGLIMALMAMMAMMNSKGGGSSAASSIPALSANRSQLPYAPVGRPGAGGVNYFSPTTYTAKAAEGGLMGLAGGGMSNLGGYSDGGRLLRGPGDGVSDSIPATIGGKQPARLATGEFVVPARIVSELGNGDTKSGADKLYGMMDRVQKARRKTKNVAADTKAHKYLPA